MGVRAADLKGFQYSREDVDARGLASTYGQILNSIFTHELKPMEVEILVAEVGAAETDDQLFHILYDGTVVDEDVFCVLGGEADAITERMRQAVSAGVDLASALTAAVGALAGPDRQLRAEDLEVAMLGRANGRRTFRRLSDDEVAAILGPAAADVPPAPPANPENDPVPGDGDATGQQPPEPTGAGDDQPPERA